MTLRYRVNRGCESANFTRGPGAAKVPQRRSVSQPVIHPPLHSTPLTRYHVAYSRTPIGSMRLLQHELHVHYQARRKSHMARMFHGRCRSN